MRSLLPVTLALALALPAAAQERPARAVPALPRLPKLDGDLKDLQGGLALKKAAGETASFTARVGLVKDTLVLGVAVTDDVVDPSDVLDVTLFFPEAGATAQGHAFRFSVDGQRTPDPELAAPVFAQRLVKSGAKRTRTGMGLEIAIPARAFPRFPAKEALTFEICLTYADRDAPGAPAKDVSNCRHGTMTDEVLKLPNSFRDALRLKPPPSVVGLEPREQGWVGYGILHYPIWVQADVPLTPELLVSMTADQPVNPDSAHLAIPPELQLPGKRSIWPVVSGKDPYAVEGKCDAEKELRLGLYLVNGKTAHRVLEWPAATCALGRAISVGIDEQGALTIGYSNGTTANFAWSTDHFEQTQYGER